VALRWAATVRPRIVILENVEEFTTWGPLIEVDGQMRPDPKQRGREFQCFVNALRRQGYAVEWRELRACDYGAPTIRKRLFLIARRDGLPIAWPEPTHGDPRAPGFARARLKPWRTAAECIDWTIPCPSIFERTKPLADATCRRIAKGIMRYVVNNAEPFIVKYYGEKYEGQFRGSGLDEPLHTQSTENRFGLVVPSFIVDSAHGETSPSGVKRWGKGFRDINLPLSTVTASGNPAIVAPTICGVGGRAGQSRPRGLDEPLATVTSKADTALVAAVLTEHANASSPRSMSADEPLRTICAQTKGGHHALVTAFLAKNYSGVVGAPLTDPMSTITAVDHHSLVTAQLASAGHHADDVYAFLVKYYGNDGDVSLREPLHTVTTKDRFGLVTVRGEQYAIADIGLRMLAPPELFRAQGFPDDYIIDRGDFDGEIRPLTKTAQTRMCGNSVCPPLAAALVRANAPELAVIRRSA
jgi:DNA (cytosine-5)-methyltransferase 1